MKTWLILNRQVLYLSLFLSLLLHNRAIAQFSLCKVSRHQLEAPELYHPDSVYIQVKQVDSLDHLAILLINTTSDTLFFSRYESRIFVYTKAIDKNGKWTSIDGLKQLDCGFGLGEIALLPDSYFWIKRGKFHGDFTTKVRIQIGNYRSSPISVELDSNYFNPEYSLFLQATDQSLSEADTDSLKAKIYYLRSRYYLMQKQNFFEALKNLNTALELDSTCYEAWLIKGVIYVNMNKRCEEIPLVLSAAFEAWEKIPKHHSSLFKEAEGLMDVYKAYLPKKVDFKQNRLDCYTKDGQTYCYLGCGIDKYVKMYFRK
ncbi:MAG: hypothetical protein DWQ02_12035 [Bacteroidetes bacterium]|nr:MAG: hypothetical protein DWQ02_12035 [Bacteroidota bacterium]